MAEKPISFMEYARLRGVRRQTIDQYVAEGKIDRGVHVNELTGHKRIWRQIADTELSENINPVYLSAQENGRGAHKLARLDKKARPAPAKKEKAPKQSIVKKEKAPKPKRAEREVRVENVPVEHDETETGIEDGDDDDGATDARPHGAEGGLASIVGLKRQESQLKIQKAYLELQKLKGALVEKDMVQKKLFAFGQLLRESILAVPDRVIDDLMAAQTRGEAFALLLTALENSLLQLSNMNEIEINEN